MKEVLPGAMQKLPDSAAAALMRIARRIDEGFEGDIVLNVKKGGITWMRWEQTERGDVIREELGWTAQERG